MSDQARIDRIAEILRNMPDPGHETRYDEDGDPYVALLSWRAVIDKIAPVLDAALYPRIETVEQLDALPFLTIVREVYGPSPSGCDYGAVWERRTSGWQCIAGSVMPPRDEHRPRLGCRVLYTPEDQ